LVGDKEVPVLGVNYGGLGYLAEFRIEELYAALEAILEGNYAIEKRVMLAVELQRGQEQVSRNRVLNDVVINKSALARIIEIEAYLNQQFVNSFRADGLIVSTPTGSTAYNLSAQGPIIPIHAPLLALTPISPFRPRRWRGALLPDTAHVAIEVLEADKRPVAAVADHDEVRAVRAVEIQMDHKIAIPMLFDPGHNLDERILREQFGY